LFSQNSGGKFTWFQTSKNLTNGKYEGDIENGIPNGMGKVIFNNGDMYEGEWIDGQLNGQGIFISNGGGKYEGEWMSGKYHGTGTLTFAEGNKKVGKFKNGLDWNTKLYNSYGEIAGEYMNGILMK